MRFIGGTIITNWVREIMQSHRKCPGWWWCMGMWVGKVRCTMCEKVRAVGWTRHSPSPKCAPGILLPRCCPWWTPSSLYWKSTCSLRSIFSHPLHGYFPNYLQPTLNCLFWVCNVVSVFSTKYRPVHCTWKYCFHSPPDFEFLGAEIWSQSRPGASRSLLKRWDFQFLKPGCVEVIYSAQHLPTGTNYLLPWMLTVFLGKKCLLTCQGIFNFCGNRELAACGWSTRS